MRLVRRYAGRRPLLRRVRVLERHACSGGDPRADLRLEGPRPIGRFDLRTEQMLPALVTSPDTSVPTHSGVRDVLAHPNGRIYYTTYFEESGPSRRSFCSDCRLRPEHSARARRADRDHALERTGPCGGPGCAKRPRGAHGQAAPAGRWLLLHGGSGGGPAVRDPVFRRDGRVHGRALSGLG